LIPLSGFPQIEILHADFFPIRTSLLLRLTHWGSSVCGRAAGARRQVKRGLALGLASMRRTRSGAQPCTQLPSPRKRRRLPQHAAVAATGAAAAPQMEPRPKRCAATFGQGAGPGGSVYSGEAHPEQRRAAASSEMLRSILSGAAPTLLRVVLEEPGVLSATAAEDSAESSAAAAALEPEGPLRSLRWEAIVYDSEEEEESGGGFGAAWLPLRAEPPVPEEGATLDLFDDNDPEEPGTLHGAESRAEGDLFDEDGFGTSTVHNPPEASCAADVHVTDDPDAELAIEGPRIDVPAAAGLTAASAVARIGAIGALRVKRKHRWE